MSGAKTEPPTPQRLRKLRDKGQVPTSRRLTSLSALLGGLVGCVAVAPDVAAALHALLSVALRESVSPTEALVLSGRVVATYGLSVAWCAALAAVFAGGVQTGWLLAPKRLAPSLASFNVAQTLKTRWQKNAWWAAALGSAQCAASVAIGWHALARLNRVLPETLGATDARGLSAALDAAAESVLVSGASLLATGVLAAIADAQVQRRLFTDQHRMSLQEIRDEYKQSEGDPEHKMRREMAHRELLAGSLREGVKRADIVVKNPTHLAIGLRYRPEEEDAPSVTVVGRGDTAKQILREARRRGLPEYADRPTARVLVTLEAGASVPPELFEPVAVIFRWLYALTEEERGEADERTVPREVVELRAP